MSDFEQLLLTLEQAKISISLDNEDLVITSAKGALTSEIKSALREHKATMVNALRNGKRLSNAFEVVVPENKITPETTVITPELLPLIDFTQKDIDHVVEQVPGGVSNIQDIYSLAPLQEGILFHHMLASNGDPYLQTGQMTFDSREKVDNYLAAVQQVIDRHDIMRTGFYWEGVSTPCQVVQRQATLHVLEVDLDPANGPIAAQLAERFDPSHYRIDLAKPPLLHAFVAYDKHSERWEMFRVLHHLIDDITSVLILSAEIHTFLAGRGHTLPPAQPFRRLIAQVRLGKSPQEHERYFRSTLADIDEPTAPYGLVNMLDDFEIIEVTRKVPQRLNDTLRAHARRLGVSLGSICHLAWGQVLACISGQDAVVFGTILFGRMHAGDGADQIMGPFINTLPIRLDMSGVSVEDSVRNTHKRLAELLSHEHASLALALRCSGVSSSTPLFNTLFNYRHNRESESKSLDFVVPEADQWDGFEERTTYPITLSVDDYGSALGLNIQVVDSLDPELLFAYTQQALENIARALDHAPNTPMQQIAILPESERHLLLNEWNNTDKVYPDVTYTHQMFEAQVKLTPAATALRFGDRELSYAELNALSNQLAHHLHQQGVKPDDRVAICLDRSIEMVVGLMGITKAGGAYVPLDPDYPQERLSYILQDSAPKLLLLDKRGREVTAALDTAGIVTLELDTASLARSSLSTESLSPAALGLTSRHLAYVIYTSGSTGKPKGVENEHRGLINRLQWMQDAYQLDGSDAVLQKTTFSFDVSVWEFFWPLSVGATLVVAPPGAHKDTQALAEVIQANNITTLHFVPSMLNLFLANDSVAACRSLRRIVCSGEALSSASVARCHKLLPDTAVHNLYGPTEAAIDVTSWTCPKDLPETATVPIGRPIANLRIYLLDQHLRPVPRGVVGELYIGGVGVARGYLNRPDLTAERFVNDPFVADADARMYRTGDVARYLADGDIEYLGRNDNQVKIRGFRIELGEIDAELLKQPSIGDAVVVARADAQGDLRLVAYVVLSAQAQADGLSISDQIAQWRSSLAAQLPEYMVPAAFVKLDQLPLTANGKLDRKALPQPDDSSFSRRAYEAPQGDVEIAMAELWQELLGVERIGRHDNFFELGGHSLLAVQLMEHLRQRDLSTEIRALFDSPTLAELSARTIELDEMRL
ncbi:solanimycin non-ribosomal peptide synthetase SolG [Dickeya fangzhongdai]|uniref:Non-ribosomal peptide synthetase n=1 Tax=Dickeya fangzhongdai TaxID=1778540 RepID=A0A2K8QMX6_9GAMM|nr:solanimycin non-ribosomal peptide synthetase SolG [Dickeya fangzhongdai]ATZ94877.1 non-ribosomal peptide synthetase [Dickeya fangzhongdai]QOH48318.1 non-ribosomal peptide synthetase [Dickeya fangzhongdai]QOH52621.1 non-ribosomal peptide synthetase [Dickeya fangzhongdai]WOY00176.1 non-ribosomal peptide synthetase [Dickeya fangzhongdai]WOY04676.1 non-ribosomal peptide synthetase [Dickeya fangzhongdai]